MYPHLALHFVAYILYCKSITSIVSSRAVGPKMSQEISPGGHDLMRYADLFTVSYYLISHIGLLVISHETLWLPITIFHAVMK